ncbi:TraR/DksA C4-type zinc finger protein [Desulfolucanica intricata]|uniref:TraR/DksA C4-type zinc finger protein n=1 Tax=Desulfolucanica intricata TaxID=1285191 RepID=UPI00082B7C30|nr:TraR/DksA C4-type zinc finger protein [Desulfolucanica intricata]
MNQQQLGQLKKSLLEEKDQLEKRIHGIDEGGLGTSLDDSISELSSYDNHPADVGSEVFERSKDFALREDAMIKLRAVKDALSNIDRGTYGRCEVCGQEIPSERLEAMPYTTMCKDCKAKNEDLRRKNRRPAEEDVLVSPFERSFNDNIGDEIGTMYDGEDAWQDVARWQEHAPQNEAGAYFGDNELVEEDRGYVEEVENISYEIGDDGVIYQDFRGIDDDSAPAKRNAENS